jgi:hypothetical protein
MVTHFKRDFAWLSALNAEMGLLNLTKK